MQQTNDHDQITGGEGVSSTMESNGTQGHQNSGEKIAEDQLRYSEERFRVLLDNLPAVAIQGYDANGTVHYWNRGSEVLYGYSASQAVGKQLVDLIVPPELRDYVQSAIADGAKTGEMPPPDEVTLMHADGSPVPVLCSHAVVSLPDHPPELFCIDINLTSQKQTEEELRSTAEMLKQSQERLRRLGARAAHVKEEEQRRIAQRIHDDFGQRLTMLTLDLTWLRDTVCPHDSEAHQRIEGSLKEIQDLLALARDISTDLRPAVLDHFGLPAALEWSAETFESSTGVEMDVDVDNRIRFEQITESALFRIVKELLTNITRHAQAQHVSLSLQEKSGCAHLVISDDGSGLDRDASRDMASMGFLAMQETALSIGASIDIGSDKEQGTTARICIPLPEHRDDTGRDSE